MISLIAAMSENRVIGVDNKLPWHIPTDLKRFHKITKGHPVIMGRKTFDSIKKALPNRTNIIVTRNSKFSADGCIMVDTIQKGIDLFPNQEVFILGGGEIYNQTIGIADKIYLTVIHRKVMGDAFFPEFDATQFNISFREDHTDPEPFSFIDYTRKI